MQLVSAEETAQLDKDWEKWRKEWVRRRKVFHTYTPFSLFDHAVTHANCYRVDVRFWSMTIDALTPQQATELSDDLGVELDSPEHVAVERGSLCAAASVLGKRRR